MRRVPTLVRFLTLTLVNPLHLTLKELYEGSEIDSRTMYLFLGAADGLWKFPYKSFTGSSLPRDANVAMPCRSR